MPIIVPDAFQLADAALRVLDREEDLLQALDERRRELRTTLAMEFAAEMGERV